MSYELEDLVGRTELGVFTPTKPLVAYVNMTSADSRSFVVALTVSAATGSSPYAAPVMQTTWDDGDTWETVSDVELEEVTATTGTFLVYATAVMSPVSPQCRITWTPNAGCTITVSDLRKSRHAPGDSPISTPPNTSTGATTVSIVDPIGAAATAASVPVNIATDQATQTAPFGVRETNGTDWLGTIALAAAQLTSGAVTAIKMAASTIMGWDSVNSTHKELLVGSNGAARHKDGNETSETVRNDYSSVNVTTAAWVELIASTAAETNMVEIFDSSGSVLELGTGGAGAEVRKIFIMPGGNGKIPLDIAAGTRIALKAVDTNATTGQICINLYKA